MYRKVKLDSSFAVAAYAYCEDLLRPTTPDEEAYQMSEYLSKSLKSKVLKLLKNRVDASVLRDLENIVQPHDFEGADVPVKLVQYCWESGTLSKEETETSDQGHWPVVNLLMVDRHYFILYTTQMNYVDGYNPLTGDDSSPIIPDSLIKSIRLSLRHRIFPKPRGSEPARISGRSPKSEGFDEFRFREPLSANSEFRLSSPPPPNEVLLPTVIVKLPPELPVEAKQEIKVQEIVTEEVFKTPKQEAPKAGLFSSQEMSRIPLKQSAVPHLSPTSLLRGELSSNTPVPMKPSTVVKPVPKKSSKAPRKSKEIKQQFIIEDEYQRSEGSKEDWREMAQSLQDRDKKRERCADCALI
jgi:hypothetical protein